MSTAPSSGLPPLAGIRAALRRTTEHLAMEIHAPTASAPDWSPLEWAVARAVSAMQGITVLLANRLRWRGPASWQDCLAAQRELAMRRDECIGTLLSRIDAALRTGGVACVGLKGTALRRHSFYLPGERPMGDIDLMTAPRDDHRVARILQHLDYQRAFESERHVVYSPHACAPTVNFGEHPDNALKIEVHAKVSERLPIEEVGISVGWLDGAVPGINAYPADAELLRHLLLHAAGNMRAHALRLIQLHDIAALAARLDETGWQRLLETSASRGGAWWMWPPLALASRYYPGAVEPEHLAAVGAHCPPLLRRVAARITLTEVSWSNLRIAAFPGIYWSRSTLDALRFARSRILPSRVALDDLRNTMAAQPSPDSSAWYGISHLHRILRWTLARAPRAQTMMSLRAALAADGTSLNA